MKKKPYTCIFLLGLHLVFGQLPICGNSDLLKLDAHYFVSELPERFFGNPKKGTIFNNPDLCLHGFHLDYTKLKPMFEHGLLSIEELEKRGIVVSVTHGGVVDDSKITGVCNGRNQISLSSVRLMNGNNPVYSIANAITLVVGNVELSMHDSEECGSKLEVRIDGVIPPEYFVGLIIPNDVLCQTIDKIDFMVGYEHHVSPILIREMLASKINYFQDNFGIENAELNNVFHVLQDIRFTLSQEGFQSMNQQINDSILRGFEQKFNRQQRLITFWDVIKPLIPANFPIYNENGDLIEDIWQKEGYELLVPEISMPEGW